MTLQLTTDVQAIDQAAHALGDVVDDRIDGRRWLIFRRECWLRSLLSDWYTRNRRWYQAPLQSSPPGSVHDAANQTEGTSIDCVKCLADARECLLVAADECAWRVYGGAVKKLTPAKSSPAVVQLDAQGLGPRLGRRLDGAGPASAILTAQRAAS